MQGCSGLDRAMDDALVDVPVQQEKNPVDAVTDADLAAAEREYEASVWGSINVIDDPRPSPGKSKGRQDSLCARDHLIVVARQ
jgi:hypothetical protein